MFETLETAGLAVEHIEVNENLKSFHQSFKTHLLPNDGVYQNFDDAAYDSIAGIFGLNASALDSSIVSKIFDSTHQMLYGVEQNGNKTLGLNEISSWNINPEYKMQNLKQQSGYAAEVVSTWKENVIAEANHTGIKTYRADDLPDLFPKNDPYVDKVRMNASGEIIERIQTKFVGKNGNEWLSKVMSKDFDKYFDGHVDKLECPSDYYDDIIKAIPEKRAGFVKQLERVTADGKTDVAQKLQAKIDRLDQIDKMVEKSTVSTDEAMAARLHPKTFVAKMFSGGIVKASNMEGLKAGGLAALITCGVSVTENISDYLNGEITSEEMVLDTIEDTAAAGALGYTTTFVSSAVSSVMRESSSQLIQAVGGSCCSDAVISFALETCDDIVGFAKGEIGGAELAYNIGKNAAAIAGTAVGFVVGGEIGGAIGCVVATEAYATAVELVSDGVEYLADKAVECANTAIQAVSDFAPEALDTVKNAFHDFLGKAGISADV